jgi:hypothetical protein
MDVIEKGSPTPSPTGSPNVGCCAASTIYPGFVIGVRIEKPGPEPTPYNRRSPGPAECAEPPGAKQVDYELTNDIVSELKVRVGEVINVTVRSRPDPTITPNPDPHGSDVYQPRTEKDGIVCRTSAGKPPAQVQTTRFFAATPGYDTIYTERVDGQQGYSVFVTVDR